jgi:phosphodiester glycosidase
MSARAGSAACGIRRAAAASIFCLAILVASPLLGRAQSAVRDDSVSSVEISPGVTLSRVVRARGPFVVHVLSADLHQRDIAIESARACDQLTGRERPSAISGRLRGSGIDVIAVLNSGFFDLVGGTGTSESNVLIDGEIVKGVSVTESPFDRFDNVHSQFGLTESGKPVIDRFSLTGVVRTPRKRWPLGTLNGAPVADAMSLYTEWTAQPPRFPAGARSAAVPLVRIDPRGDTLRFRVAGPEASTGDSAVRRSMLVGSGRAAADVAGLRTGEIISVVARFTPNRGAIRTLVGGWPRIVRDGENVASLADSTEGTKPNFSAVRHPRSAVGFSKDSATIYLVAVDGRRAWSVGMTLDELADEMIALGAWQALNLDGGGSTSLVVRDSIVNAPSDTTGERAVGDVIVVTRRGPADDAGRRTLPAIRRPATCVTSGSRDPDSQPARAPR